MPNLVRDNSQPWERVEEPGRHFKGGPCQSQIPVQESDSKKKEGPAEAGGREGLQHPASRTQFIRMWQREKAFCRHSFVNERHNRTRNVLKISPGWTDQEMLSVAVSAKASAQVRKTTAPVGGQRRDLTGRQTVETSIRHFSYYWEDKWKTNKSQEYKRLIKILNWF